MIEYVGKTYLYRNVEKFGSVRQHSGTQIDLDELVAELVASRTCRGEFATRGAQVFKSVLKFFLVELPFKSNFKLKISCSTKDECNLVYNKISNNCTLSNQ